MSFQVTALNRARLAVSPFSNIYCCWLQLHIYHTTVIYVELFLLKRITKKTFPPLNISILWEQNLSNNLVYFLTSVLSVNKPYSSLSQEASPHIKHSAVSWQPARYFILLEASGLIIMVFNLKHGRCPEWLPLRPCTAVRSGLKQPKVSGAVWFLYNVNSWRKKKSNEERAGSCWDSK